MNFLKNLIYIMREREGKVMVELVGCQYSRDGMPSSTPLPFFLFKKNDIFVKSHRN